MYAALDATCPHLPPRKPRYLMGVGAPEDIVEAVFRGVDFFDCVLPTRIARNGAFLTPAGRLNIRNARFTQDLSPVQEGVPLLYLPHLQPRLPAPPLHQP